MGNIVIIKQDVAYLATAVNEMKEGETISAV